MARTRNERPVTFTARGLSDAVDGSVAFPGAMAILSNLIPDPKSRNFVARPASVLQTSFSGFTTPGVGTALFTSGTRIYGMIGSADFAGKDRPFCYDTATQAFINISGMLAGNLPATVSSAGDWQPPKMALVGSRIIVTHPGFPGGNGSYFGWIDISSFTSNTITGNTHSNKTLDNLSTNPIAAGWEPGMTISSSNNDIPAGTTIVSLTAAAVVLSAAATGSNNGGTMTVSGGTPAAPLWGSGNTNTNPLPAVPAGVEQFNGRAWYLVNNSIVFSDALNATQVSGTVTAQVLTAGTNVKFVAIGGLPLASPLTGGVVQALFAFQGNNAIYQITGDLATTNLLFNQLKTQVGTVAPASLCSTPLGLAFIATDGLRILDETGTISDPIGAGGEGVTAPFINAVNPTRIAAAYNQNVIRVSVTNGSKANNPREEYWFDFTRKIWTGPHTFPADIIAPLASGSTQGFALFASGIAGNLWTSAALPNFASTYVENGSLISWTWQNTLIPDNEQAAMNAVIETTLMLSLPLNQTVAVNAADESGNSLNQVNLTGTGMPPAIWGSFNWGAGNWGTKAVLKQLRIPWTAPLVFKQMSIAMTGQADANVAIGNLYAPVQVLEYMLP